MKNKNILFTFVVTLMLAASLFLSSTISANEIDVDETNQGIDEIVPTDESNESIDEGILEEKNPQEDPTLEENQTDETPALEEFSNLEIAEDISDSSVEVSQTTSSDQMWTEVRSDINSVQDLQVLINNAGTTPTKIFLNKDIKLLMPYNENSPSGLSIGEGQTIYLTSTEGNTFKIDNSESGSSIKAVIQVKESGILYTGNIILTGGDRTTDAGGGGGVLLGVGPQVTDKGAIFHMNEGTIITGNKAGFGGGVYISEGSEFHMHGGEISENSITNRGGGVFGFRSAKFYLYNGDLRDNKTSCVGCADAVYMEGKPNSKGTFIMYNGRIFKSDLGLGQKTSRGGGVQVEHTNFDMYDGEIYNFFGNGSGGGVGVLDSIFNMYDGKIYRNINFFGNGVIVHSSERTSDIEKASNSIFNMYGGIIGGESKEDGNLNESSYGAVGLGTEWGTQGGTFNMYGGKIKNNDSPGISSTRSGVINIMNNSEISNNTKYGIRIFGNSVLTISDEAVVSHNSGGIHATSGVVTLNDNVKITNNRSETTHGGGIFTSGTSELYLNGGEISNNYTRGNGGGLHAGGKVYLRDIEFFNNEARLDGGGIYAPDYSNIHILEGGTISFYDNQSQYIGVAAEIPNVGTYEGTITRTTLDNHTFTGVLKSKINEFLDNGGTLKELVVFNNHDINMTPTEFFYEVTFDSNGGSEVPKQLVTDDGTGKAELPVNPTLRHYTFDAWYTDPELTTVYDFDTIVESNMTLYAGWTRNVYNINYELNGGINSNNNPVSYISGIGVSEFEPATRDGYDFIGWHVNDVVFTSVSEDMEGEITLHAQWKAIEGEEPNEETPTDNTDNTDNTPKDEDTKLPQTGVSSIITTVAGLTIVMGGLVLVLSHTKKKEDH